MWPIFAIANKCVAIFFTEEALSCYWILRQDQDDRKMERQQLVVGAYKSYPLNNLELKHLILYNPTVIKKHISSFLQENNLEDAFITFVLDGPAVTEQFVAMPTSTPHRTDFGMAQSTQSVLWEYRYLYPNDHGQFVFYVYSVPRSVILQYQLLAVAAQCNVITMTTKTMALLFAYQNIFGSAFRRSQLAVDMMRSNNNIDDLFGNDTVSRIIGGTGDVPLQERVFVAAAAGVFCSERLG